MQIYTLDEVAEKLGVHRETARAEVATGALEGFSVGKGTKRRQWRVTHEALERYIEFRTVASQPKKRRQPKAASPNDWFPTAKA